MRSMSAPSEMEASDGTAVWHYDGLSALRQEMRLVVAGDGFALEDGENREGPWPLADLQALPGVNGDAVFGLKGRRGWRIGFAQAVPPELATRLARPPRYGRIIDRIGLWPAAAVFAVLAVIAVTLVLRTPSAVARLVPRSYERQLGTLMVGDLGDRACRSPQGQAALQQIVERIDPGDRALSVNVVHQSMVNAVTLPGGTIVVFDQLLAEAHSPEEVAGVLAHEIGHVEHRDVMESLIRQAGLSVLLGGLNGSVGNYTNLILSTTYTRGAEERADGYALDALATAQVSPLPLAEFFRRLSGSGEAGRAGRIMGYLSTHPMSADRAQRFRAAAAQHHGDRPILDKDQWAALQNICRDDPTPHTGGFVF